MNKGLYIDGRWQTGKGDVFVSTDPASGDLVWEGSAADAEDVDAAFKAAHKAFGGWSETSLEERIACLSRYKQLVLEHKQQLAELISRESGKVLWETLGEVAAVAGKVDISVHAYGERTGTSSTPTAFGRADLVHRPHGIMAVLGPYNFPAHLPNGQIVPALLAGNTVVFKPSELCPAVGEFLTDLYTKAGFPAGVINMVQGARETGGAVLDHPLVDGVLFTGSASTGAFIHKKFGGRPDIILALEMGGNNPLIAWDVSDAEATANLIVQSAFNTTGQRCTCTRRLVLPKGKAGDKILDAVVAMTDQLRIGAWNDDNEAFMGPLISSDIAARALQNIDALDGKTIKENRILDRGPAFITPGIMDVSDTEVPDEEIFAPFLQVYRTGNFDQALARANNTRFGLSAGLISDDADLWPLFRRKIRAGVVNFNRPTTGAASFLPFGGPGLSGNHNPGAFYSADFCAWPMASQVSDKPEVLPVKGLHK